MSETIGKYLQKRVRSKGLEDKDVASFLNIATSTAEKIYLNDDMYISRLEKFSEILDEDIILNYYYTKQPLKRFKQKEANEWNEKISALNTFITERENTISLQKELIEIQRKYIIELEQKMGQ